MQKSLKFTREKPQYNGGEMGVKHKRHRARSLSVSSHWHMSSITVIWPSTGNASMTDTTVRHCPFLLFLVERKISSSGRGEMKKSKSLDS